MKPLNRRSGTAAAGQRFKDGERAPKEEPHPPTTAELEDLFRNEEEPHETGGNPRPPATQR